VSLLSLLVAGGVRSGPLKRKTHQSWRTGHCPRKSPSCHSSLTAATG
jgi:hypothetical protein